MIVGRNGSLPICTWSDDTSMILCTMESLIEQGTLNDTNLMEKFLKWYRDGINTPYGICFDIGDIVKQSLIKYEHLHCNPFECGGDGEYSNGNGSLMRMLPIVFYCLKEAIEYKDIYDIVEKTSSLTHRHKRSVFSCYLYVIFMLEVIKGRTNSKKVIYEKFKQQITK